MVRRRAALLLTVFSLLVTIAGSVSALEIKISSPAPEQSPWGAALNRIAAEWGELSNGRIRLRIYHNSIAGDEASVIRKMRINQLQAAVLTSAGMKIIVPEVFSMSAPFMIQSEEELNYVLAQVAPDLEEEFRQNRFHVIAWSQAGWIHFFSRDPVAVPDDLRSQRLSADPSDPELLQAFRALGFSPEPVPQQEVLTSLNRGMIDAFYTSPRRCGRLPVVRRRSQHARSQDMPLSGRDHHLRLHLASY